MRWPRASERGDVAHVGETDGLAAGHVYGRSNRDVRNVGGAHFGDEPLEPGEIHVALERVLGRRIVRLRDDDIVERAAGQFLMGTCGGEVHVARDVVAGLDEQAREDVFGAAALVCGDDMGHAVVFLHCTFQRIEVA